MLKLYFAHNFNHRKEFRELELALEQELGIELYNPFYDDPERVEEMAELDARLAVAQDKATAFENRFQRRCDSPEMIVKRDLKALAGCDGLFTVVEKPSFGTAIEICNATLMKKPIYFVSEVFSEHPWIKVYATQCFKTIEGFKEAVKKNNLRTP